MGHYRTCSNNDVISDSGIAQNNTVCSDKHIVTDADNTYFRMCSGFCCAGIMGKKPNITC